MNTKLPDNNALRKLLRQQRRALNSDLIEQSSHAVQKIVLQSKLFSNIKHIALYMAHDGEIDPSPLASLAWSLNITTYLPCINTKDTVLYFVEFKEYEHLQKNTFGILEPRNQNNQFPAEQLDIVFTPLVAFDKQGYRLGMGKGFYDRTFAFKKQISSSVRIIGLAYDFQAVESLASHPWDVKLNAILTPSGLHWIR